jgi:hypothetical protein
MAEELVMAVGGVGVNEGKSATSLGAAPAGPVRRYGTQAASDLDLTLLWPA